MGAEHVVYRKIMLAHDGSASATTGLRQATALARLCQAELYILGIVPTSGGFAIAQAAGGADVCGMKRRMIEQSLSEADTGEDCQGVNHVIAICEGDPLTEILAYAKEIKPDLVVMGPTDRSRFTRWFTGSTSSALLQHLPCSLLITA